MVFYYFIVGSLNNWTVTSNWICYGKFRKFELIMAFIVKPLYFKRFWEFVNTVYQTEPTPVNCNVLVPNVIHTLYTVLHSLSIARLVAKFKLCLLSFDIHIPIHLVFDDDIYSMFTVQCPLGTHFILFCFFFGLGQDSWCDWISFSSHIYTMRIFRLNQACWIMVYLVMKSFFTFSNISKYLCYPIAANVFGHMTRMWLVTSQ